MKLLKWLGIVFGSLIALIVAAAIVVPLVVDVDKYRPQIVQAADEHLNGKLELGKLSLSLWGQIRVQVDGVQLKDTAGHSVMAVKDAYFHLPFASILSGSPEMIFKMEKPELNVIKYKNGKMNATSLVKETPAATSAQGTPAAQKPAAPAQPTQIPAIVAHSRLGVEMTDALVNYTDELTGLKSQVKDLNLIIKDISLSRTMDMKLWANLDTTMGKTLAVKGPARIDAQIKPEVVNGAFDHATVNAKVNLDDLDIASGEMFHKSKGMAANADLAMVASAKEAKIDHFITRFFNAEVTSSGTVTNMGAAPAAPVVNLKVSSNEIDLKSWNQLIPMLKDYDLAGKAKLDANAQGPSDKLGYAAKLTVGELTAKAPNLKAQPRFDALVEVATDEIKNMQLTMKAPGNELTFKGKLVNFAKPQGTFDIVSPGMDLDQLVVWPPAAASTTASTAKGEAESKNAPSAGGNAKAPADLDASVDSLRANPAAAASAVVANVNIRMLQAKGIRMSDMVGKMYFKNLTAGLEGFAMKLWGGTVKANFATHLQPKQPTYTFSFLTDSLDLKQAVAANVAMVKNTVVGKAHFDITGSGASFNPVPAQQNLNAKGMLKVENATFGTIDVGKMATDAINNSISKIADKVPPLKGKTVGIPGGRESKYDLISSSFTISGGRFKAPDFATKAAKDQGIDLKGDTELGLKDYALSTTWEVIDTYDLTGARKLGTDVAGTHVDHILAEGSGPVKFPVHAGCTALQPCYSYTQVPEYLAKVAMSNVTSAATGRAKSELQKRIQSVVPKSAPPAVQNAIEDLGKKFFH